MTAFNIEFIFGLLAGVATVLLFFFGFRRNRKEALSDDSNAPISNPALSDVSAVGGSDVTITLPPTVLSLPVESADSALQTVQKNAHEGHSKKAPRRNARKKLQGRSRKNIH